MRQRRDMVATAGAVPSLPAMVLSILHGGSFCKQVMLIKEVAERERDRLTIESGVRECVMVSSPRNPLEVLCLYRNMGGGACTCVPARVFFPFFVVYMQLLKGPVSSNRGPKHLAESRLYAKAIRAALPR